MNQQLFRNAASDVNLAAVQIDRAVIHAIAKRDDAGAKIDNAVFYLQRALTALRTAKEQLYSEDSKGEGAWTLQEKKYYLTGDHAQWLIAEHDRLTAANLDLTERVLYAERERGEAKEEAAELQKALDRTRERAQTRVDGLKAQRNTVESEVGRLAAELVRLNVILDRLEAIDAYGWWTDNRDYVEDVADFVKAAREAK